MLLIFLTVISVLLLVEILLRLWFPEPPQWLEPQVQVVLDRRIGYRNRPNQDAFSMERRARINSLGFRGAEVSLQRAPGSLRILGLGNSITFGGGLADDETYLAHLKESLDLNFPDGFHEVLNAAIYGFTIRQYVPFLESVLPKVQPDMVLLGAAWRDLHYTPRFGQLQDKVDAETWENIKKKFRERIEKPDFPVSKKEILLKKTKQLLRHWRTLYVGNYYLRNLKDKIRPQNYQLWQKAFLTGQESEDIRNRRVETRKTLVRMRELCDKQGAKLVLLIFPDYKQIRKSFPKSTWPALLTEICTELEIPFLDLLPVIRTCYQAYGRSIFLPYDVHHYTEIVHHTLAEAVFHFLEKENLFHHIKDINISAA